MSRCVRTDGLLEATFNGGGLSRDQIDHAVACVECARTLAQARRFEDELRRVGMDLTPESMADAIDAGAGASDGMGGRTMGWPIRWAWAAAAAGAVLIGAVWLGGTMNESVPSGESRGPSDERVLAWANGIEEAARRSQGLWNPDQPWKLVRSERCGTSAMAFFEGQAANAERVYVWATGPVELGSPTAAGRGATVDDARAARFRATLPPCDIIVDSVAEDLSEIGGARELWTSVTGEEQPEGAVRLIGATPIADGHRAGPEAETAIPTFLVLLERQTDAAHWVEQASVSVTDRTWAIGSDVALQREGSPETMRVFGDQRHIDETVFAWIDDPRVRSVDIWIPRERATLRYSVTSPGFLLRVDARVGPVDEMEYQFLDSVGAVIASGSVTPWPIDGAGN